MTFFVGFVIGIILGGIGGLFIMALCVVSKDD